VKWSVLITPTAMEMLKRVPDQRLRRQISEAIDGLSDDPDKKGKPLLGELAGYRTMRAAGQKYRVVYKTEQEQVVVVVVALGRRKEGDRKDIYSLARKLFEQKLL